MSTMASQITSITIVYSTVYSRRRSKKTSKLRVTGLCAGNSPGPVNSPYKGPVTRKMFPCDDVIMSSIVKHLAHSLAVITPVVVILGLDTRDVTELLTHHMIAQKPRMYGKKDPLNSLNTYNVAIDHSKTKTWSYLMGHTAIVTTLSIIEEWIVVIMRINWNIFFFTFWWMMEL